LFLCIQSGTRKTVKCSIALDLKVLGEACPVLSDLLSKHRSLVSCLLVCICITSTPLAPFTLEITANRASLRCNLASVSFLQAVTEQPMGSRPNLVPNRTSVTKHRQSTTRKGMLPAQHQALPKSQPL